MDYINYIYEAVYFFNRINCCVDNKVPQIINQEEFKRLGINESVYKAIMRTLVVNNLLDYDGSCFIMTNEHNEKHRYILDKISKNQKYDYNELFNKAVNEFQFFFDSISDLEYEIYSRYNFPITFETGKEVVKHVNLTNKKVLELGGNSGGLGTAILTKNEDCLYSIVDTKIPCMIGNEFHDFDDIKCLDILHNCIKYCVSNTKFLIIEDILTGEFEPKEVIMHGLRLSVECRGGKQRTLDELISLFLRINYKLEKTVKLNNVHTMLVMGALS